MTLFCLSISSSSASASELSETSGSKVLLTANLLALCEDVSVVTASVNFIYLFWNVHAADYPLKSKSSAKRLSV